MSDITFSCLWKLFDYLNECLFLIKVVIKNPKSLIFSHNWILETVI